MKWSSGISESYSLVEAAEEMSAKVLDGLGDQSPDLVVAFASAHHAEEFDALPSVIREHFGDAVFIGCSGGGVIGEGKEVEGRPGFSLAAASLPGVKLKPFHIDEDQFPDGDAPPGQWETLVHAMVEEDPSFILLADPFSVQGDRLLMGLDYAFPRSIKIGGLASGSNQARGNALFLQDKVYDSGVVGLSMQGNIVMDAVVAQGCRPIGEPMHVTACRNNILMELNGQTPIEVLKEMFEGLNERDQQLVQHSLFIGVVMDELNDSPKLGDFLIRNIVGMDPRKGVIAVGETLKEGQTVQFHLRDADTSSDDLDLMLSNYVNSDLSYEDAGVLLFQCLGRGAALYGRPNHDTEMFRDKVGDIPLTGFFCNGEIGPVGGSTFLHGYTSSFGIIRPKLH